MLSRKIHAAGAALVGLLLTALPLKAAAQGILIVDGADPIVANRSVTLGDIVRRDHICVINGGVINVTPYSGSGSKRATGNLELIARTIFIDATSRINARGAGYSTTRCANGRGPNGTAGGRGGCSVNDSGGGGAHFGLAGRGTIDAPTQYPRDFEDDCMQTWTGSACGNRTCPGFCGSNGCYPNTTGPTVAGLPYWHNIYDPEFGSSGGDKGCRDGDGTGGPTTVGGSGGGRVVLVGLTARGTGNAPMVCTQAAPGGVIPNGSVILEGDIDAGGKRGCGFENDSGGGGGGGTVLIVGNTVTIGQNSQISAAGGLGGDTLAGAMASPNSSDCPGGSQSSGICDDCGGGGGGGIISVLSDISNFHAEADFYVGGGSGGTCGPLACIGESGGGAGELQLDGAYVGEYCDGFDNDFDGAVDENLGMGTCGLGSCSATINNCAGGAPPICTPAVTSPACLAQATDTRPRVSVILDTSASMLLDLAGRPTFGDGSADQPSRNTAQQSRMQLARESLAQVMSAYPEIDFSLARYHQDQGLDRSCQSAAWFECQGLVATYDDPTGNTGAVACSNLPVSGALPSGVANVTVNVNANGDECINYAGSCGAPRRGADILTGFGMPTNDTVRWLDGRENSDDVDLAMTTIGNVCGHSSGGDCEVRGTGPTPLAGALLAVQDYVVPIRATDPIRQQNSTNVCRSYDVILVTDGAESCNGAPITAAQQLFTQGIETYVIAVSVLASEVAQLNQIARAGSGNVRDATFVNNPAQLVPALTSIIAGSILIEQCDGDDDDCDGAIDEDFPGLGQACNNGLLGVCRQTGTIQCTSATTTGCVTPAAVPPTTESCDNDVNCVSLCNSLDDDCDGEVDEDLNRECQRGCGIGNEFCAAGAWVGCGARSPSVEICNNFDDDCDNSVDEGANGMPLTRPCATACGPGVETCTNGVYPTTGVGSCSAPTSMDEECNNIDDNCNGVIDDGNPGGGERCIPRDDGGYTVVDPTMIDPQEELCNPGTVTCTAGQLRCVGASSRSAEVCNCADDDCDGLIDEAASTTLCPGDSVCITTAASGSTAQACFCASPCQESEFASCPPGRVCDTSYASSNIIGLCLRGMCEGVTCPDTAVCDPLTGVCEDLCDMITCPTGRTCVRGRCTENNCYGRGCPSGEICYGACISDPCLDARCDDNEFCRPSTDNLSVGECVAACDSCGASQVCIDGTCVEDPCGRACSQDEVCVDGECRTNVCLPICGVGRVCHGGTCAHDPCSNMDQCPSGTTCSAVDSGGVLHAQCSPPVAIAVDGGAAKQVLAAGGGGCTCAVVGGAPARSSTGGGALFVAFMCVALLVRRRARSVALVGAVSLLAVVSITGCTVDPFCLENCGGSAGTVAGTSGGGSGGTSGTAADSGPMRTDAGRDGCEPSTESCNGTDDDCDNLVDEDFALMTDPANCGGCDAQCVVPNAFPACVAGECAVDSCEAGYHDRNRIASDGCEYACTESGAEVCDKRDNDCDTRIDEDTDILADIANCGDCGVVCNYANAVGACASAVCEMRECVPGFVDVNGVEADGCEVRCTSTAEACNALDDDCDGRVDEELTPPSFCRVVPNTPCAGVTSTCRAGDSGTTWYCDYPATVDFSASLPNGLAMDEQRCDGIDNDCDGRIDEAFGDVGLPCNDGELGICRGVGTIGCATLQSTACQISNAGQTAAPTESCNGLDDDCDGRVDEGSIDDLVHITHTGQNFYIYRYEASRTDAAATDQGINTARPCSKPSVMPWTKVSRDAAQAACIAVNMRLCTATEWTTACAGAEIRAYPYVGAYAPQTCNGADYGTAQGGQRIRATGALSTCVSQEGVRDLSGNVKEWTSQLTSGNYEVRGGSYASPELGLTCATRLSQATTGTLLDGTGFRCCSNTQP